MLANVRLEEKLKFSDMKISLLEKLESSHNETCNAKTEELRNQVESFQSEIESLSNQLLNKNEQLKMKEAELTLEKRRSQLRLGA